MITFSNSRLITSDCNVILHVAGVHSLMDGKLNSSLDTFFPNVKFNMSVRHKKETPKLADILITRQDKTVIITLFCSLYDFDLSTPVKGCEFNYKLFADALEKLPPVIDNCGFNKAKFGAISNFGFDKSLAPLIRNFTYQFLADYNLTFFRHL